MTVTIEQRGRWGYITSEIDERLDATLYNKLAYKRQGWEHMPNKFMMWVRFYSRAKKRFPIGLLNNVRHILHQWEKHSGEDFEYFPNFKYVHIDYEHIESFKSIRDYQCKAVAAMGITEEGGIVHIPTGGGKTFVAVAFLHVSHFQKPMIVVPTRDLKEQWEKEVGHMIDVHVETYQKLSRQKHDMSQYDLVIFDECHHVPAKSLYTLAMKCDNARVYGLTATPYRDYKPEMMKLEAAIGPMICTVKVEDLVKQGYLVPSKVRIIPIEHEERDYWEQYHDIYDRAITNNHARNLLICREAAYEAKFGIVLIMVDKIAHGKALLEECLECEYNAVFVSGQTKDRKKVFEEVKSGKYDIVIATKVYGEGVNFPILQTLILAGGGKSATKIVQQIGRILRLFEGKNMAMIIDFDDKVDYLHDHFQHRLEMYKENGVEIIGKGKKD